MDADFSLSKPPLTAKVLRKTEVSKDIVELLLDESGTVAYCWLEGEHWVRKLRQLEEGETVLISAYRWFALPADSPVIPAVPNKTVSPGYIYVSPSDAGFQITPQRSRAYPPLASILFDAFANPWTKRDIIATVIDVSVRDFGSEILATLRLTDESLSTGKCVFAHVLSKKLGPHCLQLRSLGDIIAIHGCTLQLYSDKPQISASRSSSGWGVFAYDGGNVHSQSVRFVARAETLDRAKELRGWTESYFQAHSLCGLQETVPSLGALHMFVYKLVDFVAKVVRREDGFPQGKCTLVLADEAGYTSVELSDAHSSPLKVGSWVKVSKGKVTRSLEMSQCAAVIRVPDVFFDVAIHKRNYQLFGDTVVAEEAERRLERKLQACEELRERVRTQCEDETLPLWSFAEAISPMSPRRRVRIKGLFIDLQPMPLLAGFRLEAGQWRYTGLLRLYSDSVIASILVTETSATGLFAVFEPIEESLEGVRRKMELLAQGNSWMEVGVERAIVGEEVLLRLYRTRIV